ncbi:MAG: GNAT family N-acetyltransferase [Methylovirgula sp.]
MSSEVQKRPLSYTLSPRKNLAPLADLWVASWQATLPMIDFAARRDWFCTYVEEIEQRGGATLCAHDPQGCVAGFILLDIPQKILEQIAVAPALFGSGLGASLLNAAKDRCRDGLSLAVNADNPRALRFYEKHGFVRVSESVNPCSGLPIWHMRWPGVWDGIG